MGMRMLETMYVAELMNLNAFDQPNVELYKDKTRKILGL
jgi:glucose-6-phosphate isomerase